MPEYISLIDAADVPAGEAVRVSVNGQSYIVCNDGGRYYVTDCTCPHAGAILAGGKVSHGCIVCPMHHWPWNLTTGLTDTSFPDMRLARYLCEVRSGTVFAAIAPQAQRPDLDCQS